MYIKQVRGEKENQSMLFWRRRREMSTSKTTKSKAFESVLFLLTLSQSCLVLANLSLGAALLHGLDLLLLDRQIQELVELLL